MEKNWNNEKYRCIQFEINARPFQRDINSHFLNDNAWRDT